MDSDGKHWWNRSGKCNQPISIIAVSDNLFTFCHLAPCSFCLDPLVSFANLLSVFFVILFLLNPFCTFCALHHVFGSSSTSTLLWPEITVRSVWDATAGLLTLWITATTLCLAQFTLGKNSCTLIQPGKMFPSMHTLTVHVKRHTYCMCIHITICRNHTFYMLTARKCFTVFCSPPKSQYSANSAALMQTRCRAVGFLQCCYCTHYIKATRHTSPSKTLALYHKTRDMADEFPHVHWHHSVFIITETNRILCELVVQWLMCFT